MREIFLHSAYFRSSSCSTTSHSAKHQVHALLELIPHTRFHNKLYNCVFCSPPARISSSSHLYKKIQSTPPYIHTYAPGQPQLKEIGGRLVLRQPKNQVKTTQSVLCYANIPPFPPYVMHLSVIQGKEYSKDKKGTESDKTQQTEGTQSMYLQGGPRFVFFSRASTPPPMLACAE
jgi:hypothetical protein